MRLSNLYKNRDCRELIIVLALFLFPYFFFWTLGELIPSGGVSHAFDRGILYVYLVYLLFFVLYCLYSVLSCLWQKDIFWISIVRMLVATTLGFVHFLIFFGFIMMIMGLVDD